MPKNSNPTIKIVGGVKHYYCSGTCKTFKIKEAFYQRAEYVRRDSCDYACKECRREASNRATERAYRKAQPKIDDEFIYCW